jgi:anti-anti-sigma regulatory factor
MLKIVKVEGGSAASPVLRLHGRLTGRWVQELSSLCEPILNHGDHLTLDCEGVGFADADGIALMKALQCRQVRFLKCSPFINLQLGEMDVPEL